MPISKHEALDQITLTTLADLCIDEITRYRSNALTDDRYCLELLRRAVIEQTGQAWSLFQQCMSGTIRAWMRSHPNHDVLSEEKLMARTFSHFWYAVHDQHVAFTTLPILMCYLHATLNGILIDTRRSNCRLQREASSPGSASFEQRATEEPVDAQKIWKVMESLLSDVRERRIAYLLYFCGLKPMEIVIRCPEEFDDVKEIYHLRCVIVEKLRKNSDRWR